MSSITGKRYNFPPFHFLSRFNEDFAIVVVVGSPGFVANPNAQAPIIICPGICDCSRHCGPDLGAFRDNEINTGVVIHNPGGGCGFKVGLDARFVGRNLSISRIQVKDGCYAKGGRGR